jgi:hypothetical protein
MGKLLVGAIAATGLAFHQVSQFDPQIVKGKYQTEKGSIEVIGVCKVSGEAFQCWNIDGKRDSVLSRHLLEFAKSNRLTLQYQFGSKNRQIIYATSNPKVYDPDAPYFNVNIEQRLFSQSQLSSLIDLKPGYVCSANLGLISVPESQKTVDLTATASFRLFKNVDQPIEVGTKFDINGIEIQVKRVVSTPCSELPGWKNTSLKNLWTIYFSVTQKSKIMPTISVFEWSAFNEEKLRIAVVDVNGVPAFVDPSIINKLPSLPPYRSEDSPKTEYNKANFDPNPSIGEIRRMAEDGSFSLTTDVDPKYIRSFSMKLSANQAITFANIPLDPR